MVEIFISHLSPLHKIILPGTESATKNCRKYRFSNKWTFRGGHFVARSLHFCCRWRKNRVPASSPGLRLLFRGMLFDAPIQTVETDSASAGLRRNSPKAEDLLQVEPLVWRLRHILNALGRRANSILTCLGRDARVPA